jgi:3-dehydroquinate synthase
MNTVNSIYSGSNGWKVLQEILLAYYHSGIYILVDENTKKYCLPVLQENCNVLNEAGVIELQSSESNKTIAGAETIWQNLLDGKAVRNSLLICLGGGVITDIGGFCAATFKRGLDFIHIPTTLLSMVDAAIGGKTGVNLNSVKNQIGVFALPKAVFVFPEFLVTLPERQRLSGYAEMLKHAMIDSKTHFEKFLLLNSLEKACSPQSIMESADVKLRIVNQDFNESGLRKALNFGHTIGHAFETYSQKHDADPLLHGEAIAIGLVCESFISMRMFGFDENDLKKMVSLISWHFPHYRLKSSSADELLAYMHHDKKNNGSANVNFSLIRRIGEPVFDQYPGEKLIRESLHFYMNMETGFFV